MTKQISQADKQRKFKYLDIILCLAVAFMVICNTTAGKIVHFGIFTVSVTALYFPFIYLIGDILTEVYGYKQGRRVMWILIFIQILDAVIYQIVAFLPSVSGVKGNEAYMFVLGQVPRNVIGGLVALFFGSFVGDFTLAKMKVLTKGKYLWTRTIGSTITGEFFDTALFYTIALFNILTPGLLIQSILSGWLLKIVVETVLTPVTYVVVNKLKKLENEDYFDKKTNFNPFILQIKSTD